MDRKTGRCKEVHYKKAMGRDEPVEESLLIRQRLRNLCELVIAIGQKQGLLCDHMNNDATDKEGGSNVTDKGSIRDCKAAPAGQD